MTLICPTWVPYCEVIQIEKKKGPGFFSKSWHQSVGGLPCFFETRNLNNAASGYWELS